MDSYLTVYIHSRIVNAGCEAPLARGETSFFTVWEETWRITGWLQSPVQPDVSFFGDETLEKRGGMKEGYQTHGMLTTLHYTWLIHVILQLNPFKCLQKVKHFSLMVLHINFAVMCCFFKSAMNLLDEKKRCAMIFVNLSPVNITKQFPKRN